MSTHEVLVVQIENIFPHENADTLEIVKISGYDYSIVAKKNDFHVGELGIYIEPDYCVPLDRSEFSWLEKSRITCKRLRGVWSEGLLIHAQAHHKLGDNVIDEYKITRWEPSPVKRKYGGWDNEGSDLKSGWIVNDPQLLLTDENDHPYDIVNYVIPKYDLENYKKYSNLIIPKELVFYTIKIHGANTRFVFHNGEMYCGSRTTWKCKPGTVKEFKNKYTGEIVQKEAPDCSWWSALEQNPWIEEWCKNHPGVVLYGEIFGPSIQGHKFHYGLKDKQLGVRIFDILQNRRWLAFGEMQKYADNLKLVPCRYAGPHNSDLLKNLAEENEDCSYFENCGDKHIREGIVIKLAEERVNSKIGRIALKYVSNNYLMRS